tara:strand:- start:442 stop:1128 length:687 start_codon:yes stop_codon:yes gene_type:complete
MKFINKVIILLSLSNLFGEKFIYSAGFRLFDAGEAIFTKEFNELNGEPIVEITSSIKTNSFLSKFYKVDDFIKVWSKKDDFSLIKIDKKINQGNYKLRYNAYISEDFEFISNKNKIQLESKVYDPISAIFMIREKPLLNGDSYKFTTIENGIIQKINVQVGDIEKISVPAGLFDTFQLIPISDDGRPLFRHDGKMKVWYSTDSLHIPVKIEQKTNVGNLILRLKRYIP